MNNYFINITKTLNLKTLNKSQIDIDKFENHISIKKIHETFTGIIPGSFHFEQVSSDTRNFHDCIIQETGPTKEGKLQTS